MRRGRESRSLTPPRIVRDHELRSYTPPRRGRGARGGCRLCQERRERIERLERENMRLIHQLRLEQEEQAELERKLRDDIEKIESDHRQNVSRIAGSVGCQQRRGNMMKMEMTEVTRRAETILLEKQIKNSRLTVELKNMKARNCSR